MVRIPAEAKPYKTVGPWTVDKIPKMLLNRHNTKAGVWAKLEVLQGVVNYFLCDNDAEAIVLTPEEYGVSEPQVWHYIKPSEDAKIKITFYSIPDGK
ncbi:MAG: DUF1971 domain-containing protein [Alphaproteobacteria bacterium]